MLYGASWFVVLVNLLATILALREGQNPVGYLPALLVAFGIIAFVHQTAGWFPFRRRM